MSFVDGNGGLSAADVAAVTGNNNGFGFGGDGAWWLLVLFLFAFNGNNGWGGNGGNSMAVPWMYGNAQNDMQRGFDQQAIMSGIGAINASLANAEVSRCNTQANLLSAINNSENLTVSGMNTLAMNLQNCCCENRAATADLKYTIATESAATRASSSADTQKVLDKLCQLEMDGIRQNYENRIANMQAQIDSLNGALNEANRTASQTAQTSRILADNAAQTVALEQYLNPTPIPAYIVQNPSCCNQAAYASCGCNA